MTSGLGPDFWGDWYTPFLEQAQQPGLAQPGVPGAQPGQPGMPQQPGMVPGGTIPVMPGVRPPGVAEREAAALAALEKQPPEQARQQPGIDPQVMAALRELKAKYDALANPQGGQRGPESGGDSGRSEGYR